MLNTMSAGNGYSLHKDFDHYEEIISWQNENEEKDAVQREETEAEKQNKKVRRKSNEKETH